MPVFKFDKDKVQKAAFFALTKVYLKAFQDRTPGDGETHQMWDVEERGFLEFAIVNPAGVVIEVLENGRRPGIIRAKNKKFLRFKKPKGSTKKGKKIPGNVAFEKDGFVFAKAVMHPGFKGRFFVEQILQDQGMFDKFQDEFTNKLLSLV